MYSLGQDLLHHSIIFDIVALTLNLESHTLDVAIHIWLPLGKLCCLLTTLVYYLCKSLFINTLSYMHISNIRMQWLFCKSSTRHLSQERNSKTLQNFSCFKLSEKEVILQNHSSHVLTYLLHGCGIERQVEHPWDLLYAVNRYIHRQTDAWTDIDVMKPADPPQLHWHGLKSVLIKFIILFLFD